MQQLAWGLVSSHITTHVNSFNAYRLDLNSLQKSIPEILALAKLSGAFNRVGVLAYRDYSDLEEGLIVWSGWNPTNLQEFVDQLAPYGGGDYPEAAKTALIRALQYVDKHSKTLILWVSLPLHLVKYPVLTCTMIVY